MGWHQVKMEVVGRVSSHNSDQDRADQHDWVEFCHRVTQIAREYPDLDLDVYGPGATWEGAHGWG